MRIFLILFAMMIFFRAFQRGYTLMEHATLEWRSSSFVAFLLIVLAPLTVAFLVLWYYFDKGRNLYFTMKTAFTPQRKNPFLKILLIFSLSFVIMFLLNILPFLLSQFFLLFSHYVTGVKLLSDMVINSVLFIVFLGYLIYLTWMLFYSLRFRLF